MAGLAVRPTRRLVTPLGPLSLGIMGAKREFQRCRLHLFTEWSFHMPDHERR